MVNTQQNILGNIQQNVGNTQQNILMGTRKPLLLYLKDIYIFKIYQVEKSQNICFSEIRENIEYINVFK